MKFQPNDKVVCIDDTMSPEDAALFSERLVKGRIYSIRDVHPQVFEDGLQCVYVVGITGEQRYDGEFGFCSSLFRKLGEASAVNVQTNQQEETK